MLLIIEFNLCFIPRVTFEEFPYALSLSVATVKVSLDPMFSPCNLKVELLTCLWREHNTFSSLSDGSIHLYFLPLFLSFSQCSRTQYVRCTDFKQWTASGCLCENKWRSAHCPLASPNSCFRCIFRRTWAGKSLLMLRSYCQLDCIRKLNSQMQSHRWTIKVQSKPLTRFHLITRTVGVSLVCTSHFSTQFTNINDYLKGPPMFGEE